jgi:ADP-dependent NAD(P)H-hydrate dehydratase
MTKQITEIPKLTPRKSDAHKGHFGRVLIIGGSRGMIGAPALAANAAFRSGAGLVRLAVPQQIQLATATLAPCATSIALADDENGNISRSALNEILKAIEDNDSVALGPGLAQSNELQGVVETIIRESTKPLVIDADGLNNLAAVLAGAGDPIKFPDKTVLTPHPGEMKRLWKACIREEMPRERTEQAEKLARRLGMVVALKGEGTVVTDGDQTYINETGNPGMATGGSGDVLTGMIAALLARQEGAGQLSALEAAILGVFVHGRAGDLAAAVMGEEALMASDLADWLPEAWQSIEE